MSHENPVAKPRSNAWGSWIAIAGVAIVMGLLLPQLMQGDTGVDNGKTETKDKGKLEYTAPPLPEAPSMQGMLTRLGVGTALVLGLCVASLWGAKRWLNPTLTTGAAAREMTLRETLHLGNRCCLHLVHLGKQAILVGVDAAGVKTIVPLPASFEETLAQVDEPKPNV